MMTLSEISQLYAADAASFDARIRSLRKMAEDTDDPSTRQMLLQRITALEPILRQCRALERYTADYYQKENQNHATYQM